jgi:hypothetical protein
MTLAQFKCFNLSAEMKGGSGPFAVLHPVICSRFVPPQFGDLHALCIILYIMAVYV